MGNTYITKINTLDNSGNINGDVSIDTGNNNGNNDFGKNDLNLKELSEMLENVLTGSDVRHERELAADAKRFADKKEKENLKKFILENLSSFTSGTFATLAGGALLEMIKALLV